MRLYKIGDIDSNVRQKYFNREEIKGWHIYSDTGNEKIGSIRDILVDETGVYRYFVIATGFWFFGKKILLPVEGCRIDKPHKRFYVTGLHRKEQVKRMPAYQDNLNVDREYEEQIRRVDWMPSVEDSASVEESLPVEKSLSVEEADFAPKSIASNFIGDRTSPRELESESKEVKLYEERLIASKNRHKKGEVTIGKRIESSTEKIFVPVEKEKIIIERSTPSDDNTPVSLDSCDFHDKELKRFELYEETADIHKGVFVREEISVKKEVGRGEAEFSEILRHEELDIKQKSDPEIQST